MQPGPAESDSGSGTKLVKWRMGDGVGLTTAPAYSEWDIWPAHCMLVRSMTSSSPDLCVKHQITCEQCTAAQSTSSLALFTKWIRLCCSRIRLQIRKLSTTIHIISARDQPDSLGKFSKIHFYTKWCHSCGSVIFCNTFSSLFETSMRERAV